MTAGRRSGIAPNRRSLSLSFRCLGSMFGQTVVSGSTPEPEGSNLGGVSAQAGTVTSEVDCFEITSPG